MYTEWEIKLSAKKYDRKDKGRSRQELFWTHHAKKEHYCNEAKIQLRLDKMDRWFQHLFTSDRRRPSIQVPKFNTMSTEIHLQ
jgi:hypothetical protein